MTAFRVHDDVAAVEHDAGKPLGDGVIFYGTATEAGPCSVRARFGDGDDWPFLLDSRGRAWCDAGRWRLVPVCTFCDMPVMGVPVTAEDDPMGRKFCCPECLTAEAESSYEQRHPSGVAT